ncbi:MAG: dTDP-glucose 4,6-dehydratase [Patescibacteria group bacterium]|nr:dTDP-glucose 4,6-dehydratase [Patescibacteria group bacterium]
MEHEFGSVLITGGSGFIGSNFLRYFYHAHPQARIVNLDLLTYAGNPENLRDLETLEAGRTEAQRRYRFVQGDICDEVLLEKVFSAGRFDLVVHFAAESHVDRSIFSMVHFVRTNIEGTRVLVETARRHAIPRFVNISTDEVYGTIAAGYAAEHAQLKPSNPYSASKAGADLLVQAYMRTHNFPAIIVRGSNNYGPYQYPEKLIPLALTNVLEGKKVPLHGNGRHVRSWLHVQDFCRAIDLVAHAAPVHSLYNVAGEERTNLEVVDCILRHLGKDPAACLQYVNDRPGADLRYAVDGSKLEGELGFSRVHRFEEAIGDVVRWYAANQTWWKNIRLKPGFLEHYERQSNGRWC